MKKKRKLKTANIAACGLVLVILFAIIWFFFFKNDFKVVMNNKTMNVGEEYQNNFKATFKGKDVTDKVEVSNNIYNTKLGKYQVTFVYKDGKKEYKTVKNISIVDKTAPEIELTRGKAILVSKNSDFQDPGYQAIDNYDGDISDKVKVEGKVDTSKEGSYTLTYTVIDSSKNKKTIERVVTVTEKTPLDMSIKDFNLDGLFEDVILKKTDDAGDQYIEDIIFAGDSMPLYYVINKEISGKQLWHRESLNPETALKNTIYINHTDSKMTFVQAFEKYKPKMAIMTLGTNSAGYMEVDYFISCYKKLIQEIKKVSPETILIIQSIPPVDQSLDKNDSGLTNDKINKFNYYLAEMCSELKVPFLNSAEAMKDSAGQCKEGYCILDTAGVKGVHPTKKGNAALIEYTRTHAYQQ